MLFGTANPSACLTVYFPVKDMDTWLLPLGVGRDAVILRGRRAGVSLG